MEACTLAATDLACRRGERLLFAGLSINLQSGQALQITGANGIGKSSLIRILAALARPFAGQVEHSGAIGLLDERPALDEHLPLARALGFWAGLDNADPARAIETLGLGDLLDVPVRYLSTGQRKRAAIVRLLAQNAPIWLLDEPLNGLDVNAVKLVERSTAAHCASGGIAVIASHQPFGMAPIQMLAIAEYQP